MSKILDNLLSNASKYAAPNSKVSIVLEPNFFSISNTGRGISKEDQMKIFDRYTRFNDDQGGFGIGLNFSQRVLQEKWHHRKMPKQT
ncbi:ATP-binding protein [Campylobacter concisus]